MGIAWDVAPYCGRQIPKVPLIYQNPGGIGRGVGQRGERGAARRGGQARAPYGAPSSESKGL